MYKIVFIFLFILTTCYMLPDTANAEGTSLKIQPATLSIRATPPADVHAPFSIENPGDDPVELTILFKRFRDNGDGSGHLVYSDKGLSSDSDSFFKTVQVLDNKVGIQSLTLGPKQKKELDLEIVALNNQDLQEHYFSIIFLAQKPENSNPGSDENNSFSSVQSGIALPVLLSLGQSNEKNTFISSFEAPLFVQKGPVPFGLQIKNSSNHFTTVKGAILIKNMFGQTVGKITLPTENILSDSARYISSGSDTNKNGMALKTGHVVWSEKLLFGFYTATLTLAVLPDQTLYSRSIHFFALPATGIVIIVIAVIIGISFLLRVKKKVSQE